MPDNFDDWKLNEPEIPESTGAPRVGAEDCDIEEGW